MHNSMSTQTLTDKPKQQNIQAQQKGKPKWFENLWRILFLAVTAGMLVLSNKIYLFHTLQQFKQVKKGQLSDLLMFGLPFAVLYIGIDYLIHYIFDPLVQRNYLRTDKYKTQQQRKIKSRVIVRWGFNVFYYLPVSIVGYFLIKNTSFMPPIFGGNGSIYTLAEHRYLDQATIGMQILYYVQFGKHVGRYFCHAFIQSQGSYYEYLLHHSLATFLILFSYTMDMWVIGIFVVVLHDLSDAFLASCRMHREYKKPIQFLLNINYVLMVVSWIGLRVIAFGYSCVWAVWYQYFESVSTVSQIQYEVFNLPYIFMMIMLFCLWVMHIYWAYYILQSFIGTSLKTNKKVQHSYD